MQAPIESLPVAAIEEPGHQLRAAIDPAEVGTLADSIAVEGLLQPLGVRGPSIDGRYEVVWGHRRLLAVRLLRWATVECRVFPATFDPIAAAVAENESRVDLTPLEQAQAVKKLLDQGHPESAVARIFRHTAQWVRERVDLLALPLDLQEEVHARRLPLAVVRVLADVDHDGYRASLIHEARRSGASATVVEVWRAHYLADRDRIIRNQETVAQIAARREAYKILVPCELCHTDHEYPQTTTVRVCLQCRAELAQAIDSVDRERANGRPALDPS